jgi:hypothetical protein
MSGICGTLGEMINARNILVGKSAKKRSHRGPKRSWQDNIKANLKEYDVNLWAGIN